MSQGAADQARLEAVERGDLERAGGQVPEEREAERVVKQTH